MVYNGQRKLVYSIWQWSSSNPGNGISFIRTSYSITSAKCGRRRGLVLRGQGGRRGHRVIEVKLGRREKEQEEKEPEEGDEGVQGRRRQE